MKNNKNLTQTERELIATWKAEGSSHKQIAKRLGRSCSTIGREIKRNSWKKSVYEPLHAHAQAETRKQKAWKAKHPLKNECVFAYVMNKLKRHGWSPEQIAGRLKKDFPDDKGLHICHETIYEYIYHADNQDKKLWEYLRRGQKKRKRKTGRKVHRSRIPDRVSIHHRPLYWTPETGQQVKIDMRKECTHVKYSSQAQSSFQSSGSYRSFERIENPVPINQ